MLNINNYIQEKLHIGKDSKSKINFDELYESLLDFFKKHFKPEEFKLDKRILNNIQLVIFESGNYKAVTKTDALLDDLSDYIDNTIKIDCDIEDHRYNTFLTIHIIPKDDSITEKLHIGKDTKDGFETNNKEDFINFFKHNGCEIHIDDDGIKCFIWLEKGKNASFSKIGTKFPFITIYLYDLWWDIRKQGETESNELKFNFTRGPRAYESMKRYQFKRTTHLLYNDENAEKILNKLNYVYDNYVK